MSYTLYIHDTPLLCFEFDETNASHHSSQNILLPNIQEKKLKLSILDIDMRSLHRLPFEMLDIRSQELRLREDKDLNQCLMQWMEHRMPPSNRQFIQKILKACGLQNDDLKGLADFCQMLSLNDAYRVVNNEHPFVPFKKCNLFENRFDEVLSLVAYTGLIGVNYNYRANLRGGICSTPELTTGGMLPKTWRWTKQGIMLYKGGTSGFANAGLEPYSEFYATQVAQKMGLDVVSYGLERWHGILASTCPIFTSKDISFVPAHILMQETNTNSLEECARVYDKFGFLNAFKDMLLFDAVVCNEDRHYANFGMLRDNYTGKIICPAPIFDNGLSLFPYAMNEDVENMRDYAKTRTPPYRGVTFDDLATAVVDNDRKTSLRRLIEFKFTLHSRYNLPCRRLKKIEDTIGERVSRFLRIQTQVRGLGIEKTNEKQKVGEDVPEKNLIKGAHRLMGHDQASTSSDDDLHLSQADPILSQADPIL